jgi:hypothetical protein
VGVGGGLPVSDDIEAVIREAMRLADGTQETGPAIWLSAPMGVIAAGLAAAVRLLREPAEQMPASEVERLVQHALGGSANLMNYVFRVPEGCAQQIEALHKMIKDLAAAAVEAAREPVELPAEWRAVQWEDGHRTGMIWWQFEAAGRYDWRALDRQGRAIGGGQSSTLAEAIAAVEAARSSRR